MRRAQRTTCRVAVVVGLLALVVAVPAWAQPQPPPQPFAPEWAMLAGWDVFTQKRCGVCHSVRGVGGRVGPDLGRIQTGTGFFDLGAAMWNHLPRMGARMREAGIDRPTLTPRDVSNLIAFLFTAQYYDELGVPKSGEALFASKGCVQCHTVGGRGGNVGPPLDRLKRSNSPVLVAAAMWNHGPKMAEAMKARGIERPTFGDRELNDVIAHIVTAARDEGGDTAQVIPGTPERGEKLFSAKRCAVCHSVGGKGGAVGPKLGLRPHHVSLTQFAALMWNHGPAMWAKMRELGIPVPQLTGQETADIVAYLYMSHYFDPAGGSAARGQQIVQSKGCLTCHSVRGKGGRVAADFATSGVVGTDAGVISAMWNHSRYMEWQAEKQQMTLPTLGSQELADISTYLGSLSKGRPKQEPK